MIKRNNIFLLFYFIVCSTLFSQNGIINSYYTDKKLRESKSYVNNILDGTCYWFYPNGNLSEERTYSKGKLNGWVRHYYENGLVKEEFFVNDGIRDGQNKFYYENGALQEIRIYKLGELIKRTKLEFDSNYIPPLEAYLGNRQNEIKKNRELFICEAEVCPKPVGGIEAIQNNLIYPEYAKLYGLEGKVKIIARVNENGNVIATTIVQGLGLGCDEAAVDAVKKTKFLPGFNNGIAVTTNVIFNVEFKLNDEEKKNAIPMAAVSDINSQTPYKPNNNVSEQNKISNSVTAPVEIKNEQTRKNFDCDADICPHPVGGLSEILGNLIIPETVKRLQIQGDVVVEADVDEYGLVRDTKVISGLGYGADDAVEVAILKTQFVPGKKNGKVIRTAVTIIVPIILN